ncbi:MAG: hypothetical protein FVQ84_11565 [Planctomycetes bacterium]|nr:hypothetical protein [Planctomycetota bacterium]
MKIDGISLQAKPFIKPKTPEPVDPEVEQTSQYPPDPAQIEEPSSIELQENDTEKGVLRNLLDGHFKGVSDVRLRINFFEELAAIEAAKVQTVAAEKVGGVLQSVGGVVTGFLEGDNELTPEQSEGVMNLHNTFNEPAADLTTAFDDFVEALRDLFAPPVKTPEEPTISETEDGDTTELPWQTFLDNLQSAFTAAADELTQAVTDLQILPELSEPNGNGVAYEKFLAIYNDLYGLNTLAAEQPTNEPVDLVV